MPVAKQPRHVPLHVPPLPEIYQLLRERFGHRDWWPGDTTLEIIIGAILTQNTAWSNVEKAITNLKAQKALSVRRLREVAEKDLAEWVRSSGYFNQKAKKIKAFIAFLDAKYSGSLAKLRKASLAELRHELLEINGIGPETADSILLYALGKPVFVVDAYTRRIFRRHFYFDHEPSYHETQERFEAECPPDVALYNDFHAQIVAVGNRFCKPKPRCEGCPLAHLPHTTD
jgi:endonuclease-3 related protein